MMKKAIKILSGSLKYSGLPGLRNLVRAFLDLKSEPDRMKAYPIIVQIEPTIHCNLECTMCANPLTGRKKMHMLFTDFKKVVDNMPFLNKISLVGAGEPLLNPELFKMIAYAKSKGILTGFATNAMFLDDKNCKKLLESGADWVNISVDSADKKRYETIRKGASIDILTENIKRLMAMKGSRELPEVSIWFVIMKENLEDLPEVIRFSKRLGVDKVSAQMEHNWSSDVIKGQMADRYSGAFYTGVKNMLIKAREAACAERVSFDYVNVPDPASKRVCKWPWKSCYITVEGFITPCCLQGSDPKIINFGNILEDDFKNIWNNKAYIAFRKALRSKQIPAICVDCTSYYEKMKI